MKASTSQANTPFLYIFNFLASAVRRCNFERDFTSLPSSILHPLEKS
jgi:hypothetical protein